MFDKVAYCYECDEPHVEANIGDECPECGAELESMEAVHWKSNE